MSNKKKIIDSNQGQLDFDEPIKQYEELRVKLINPEKKEKRVDCYQEACIEIAATVKSAQRSAGMSREQMVDAINSYFAADDNWHLSIHIFNHYLSKPTEYPIPAAIIFAIQHITGSLETVSALARAEEARVISSEEVRSLAVGKLDSAIAEMQRLKKEFRGIKH